LEFKDKDSSGQLTAQGSKENITNVEITIKEDSWSTYKDTDAE
jgi:hypothetical protein